jgi:glutamate/tyrosine decarboxylase-like PLP-dependent enzyme
MAVMDAADAREGFLRQAALSYRELASRAGALPERGIRAEEVDRLLDEAKQADVDESHGRLTMYSLRGSADVQDVIQKAWAKYFYYNALFGQPSVVKMETEVVHWTAQMMGCGSEARAFFTSGGTESVYSGVKAARDEARQTMPQIRQPELVIPDTAHAAFNKAGETLGVKVIRVKTGEDRIAGPDLIAPALTLNTIMIGGSAPNWPYATFDDFVGLGQLALEKGLWLHCDACLGGFLSYFLRDLGEEIPPFDLTVPGVRSLSVDLHKYGYAAKPASVVVFRDEASARHQAFVFDDWAEGLYPTFTFAGSRPAGAVAAAWAAMRFLGREGYLDLARRIMEVKDRLTEGIYAIDGLQCRPAWGSILLYGSQAFDIRAIARHLIDKGHYVMGTEERDGSTRLMHLTLDPVDDAWIEAYLADVREAAALARAGQTTIAGDELRYV